MDSSKLPGERTDAHATLTQAAALGFEGVLFRSILELDAQLDPVALKEVEAHAAEVGLLIEAGVAKVNPYMTAEFPDIRALGDGDYMLALRRMIEACAVAGIHEIWTATAGWKRQYPGRFQYDRFRTDAPWSDQLAATQRVLSELRPFLIELGSHLNVETHEEITSIEVVRLVEAVGPDTVGITFDVANVFIHAEDPVAAARRCAPYTRMTHLRDVALWETATGFDRFVVEPGLGVIDWPAVASELSHSPTVMLTVEGLEPGGGRSRKPVDVMDSVWEAGHPDLDPGELDHVRSLCRRYMDAAGRGEAGTLEHLTGCGDQRSFLDAARHYMNDHGPEWGCG